MHHDPNRRFRTQASAPQHTRLGRPVLPVCNDRTVHRVPNPALPTTRRHSGHCMVGGSESVPCGRGDSRHNDCRSNTERVPDLGARGLLQHVRPGLRWLLGTCVLLHGVAHRVLGAGDSATRECHVDLGLAAVPAVVWHCGVLVAWIDCRLAIARRCIERKRRGQGHHARGFVCGRQCVGGGVGVLHHVHLLVGCQSRPSVVLVRHRVHSGVCVAGSGVLHVLLLLSAAGVLYATIEWWLGCGSRARRSACITTRNSVTDQGELDRWLSLSLCACVCVCVCVLNRSVNHCHLLATTSLLCLQ
jgi:hypothetical protein